MQAFASAYNDRVHARLLWLEMLSPAKWPSPPLCASDAAPPPAAPSPLIVCDLASPDDEHWHGDVPRVALFAAHVERFVRMAAGLPQGVSFSEVLSRLTAEADAGGCVDEGGLLAAMRACSLYEGAEDAAVAVDKVAFARAIFDVLSHAASAASSGSPSPSTAAVSAVELAAALAFLLPGDDKSTKIAAIWCGALGDRTEGDRSSVGVGSALSRRGLWQIMRALLAALLVLGSDKWPLAREAARALHALADAAAVEVTASVFLHTATSRASGDAVTLDEFATYYNDAAAAAATGRANVGASCAWLELLDARKWTSLLTREATISAVAAAATEHTLPVPLPASAGTAASLCVQAIFPSTFVFDIPLAAGLLAPLRVSRGACRWLERVAAGTGLATAPLGMLSAALQSVLGGGADWPQLEVRSGTDVKEIVSALCVDAIDADACASLELFIRRFRAAAEVAGGGVATGADLWTALLVLAGSDESKSRKLEHAFATLGSDGVDSATTLLAPQLCDLFRALLITFSCIQEQGATVDLALAVSAGLPVAACVEPWCDVVTTADAAASACAIAITEASGEGSVSLSQLMSWYNSGGGMSVAVFLELLGHDRWRQAPPLVSSPVPDGPPLLRSHHCLTLLLSPLIPRAYPVAPLLGSSSDGLDDLAIFDFDLIASRDRPSQAATLTVTLWDGLTLQLLSEALGLGGCPPDTIADAVLAITPDPEGRVSLSQLVGTLVATGSSERAPLEVDAGLVHSYFAAFSAAVAADANATAQEVEHGAKSPSLLVSDALCAALLLGGGKKSSKLSTSWDVMASMTGGEATPESLAAWLHAWICALLAVKAAAVYWERDSSGDVAVSSLAARAHSEFIADAIFETAPLAAGAAGVTFFGFTEFFNSAPGSQLAWLEAVDLSKLPAACRHREGLATLLGLTGSSEARAEGDEAPEQQPAAAPETAAPTAALAPSRGTGSPLSAGSIPFSGTVTARAAVHAVSLALWSGLLALLPAVAHDVVLSSAAPLGDSVTRAAFFELLDDVREAAVAAQPDEEDDGADVLPTATAATAAHVSALGWLFDACAGDHGAERAPTLILSGALSAFCRGSKSDKLAAAFAVAAAANDEAQPSALRDVISGLLLGLACLLNGLSLPPPAALNAARATATQTLSRVSAWAAEHVAPPHATGISAPAAVPTFEDLCAVYNAAMSGGGGGTGPDLAWLELLDLRKLVSSAGDDSAASTAASAARAAPASEDWLAGTVYSIALTAAGDALVVSRRDILALEALTQGSGFGDVGVDELFLAAETATGDSGMIDGDGFIALFRALAGTASPPFDSLIDAVFRVLRDVVSEGSEGAPPAGVSPRAAAAALALFSVGGKSEKLAALFEIYADGAPTEGCLDSPRLQELLRATLAPMLVFGSVQEASPYATPASIAAACAEATALAVFGALRSEQEAAGTPETPRALSFEAFAVLYNAGVNASRAAFLELLSAKKWVLGDAAAAPPSVERESPPSVAMEPVAAPPSDVVFSLPVPSGTRDEQDVTELDIRASDLVHARSVLDAAKLGGRSLGDVYAAFAAHSRGEDGTVDKPAFNRAVRSLLPAGAAEDPEERRLLSCALSSIFYGLKGGSAVVDGVAAAAAVAVLVRAPKSAKVAEAWAHFDADGDGFLSFGEAASLLSSLLTAVLALRAPAVAGEGSHASLPDANLTFVDRDEVRRAASGNVRSICSLLGLRDSSLISFDDLSRAYGAAGDSSALSWLELVDVHKAVERGLPAPPLAAAPLPPVDVSPSSDNANSSSSAATSAVFVFPLRGTASAIRIWPTDIAHFRSVVTSFGGGDTSAADVLRVVDSTCAVAPGSGGVPLGAFQGAVRALVAGGESLPEADRRLLSATFRGAHAALTALGGPGVGASAADLLVPLLFCVGGSTKSEKLLAAYTAYCDSEEGGGGGITRSALTRLLRTVLMSLFIFRKPTASTESAAAGEATVGDLSVAAEGYAELAFSAAEVEPPATLPFERFAAFYSASGYAVLPFIELLSLRKFLPVSPPPQQQPTPDPKAPEVTATAAAWAPSDAVRAAMAVDLVSVQYLSALSGLGIHSTSVVADGILQAAEPGSDSGTAVADAIVSRTDFFKALRQLVASRESLSETEQRDMTRRFGAAFDALVGLGGRPGSCDETSITVVAAPLAAAVLIPLCHGSADSKVQALWDAVARHSSNTGSLAELSGPQLSALVFGLFAGIAVHGPGPAAVGLGSWAALGDELRKGAEATSRASVGLPAASNTSVPGEVEPEPSQTAAGFLRWLRESSSLAQLFLGLDPAGKS